MKALRSLRILCIFCWLVSPSMVSASAAVTVGTTYAVQVTSNEVPATPECNGGNETSPGTFTVTNVNGSLFDATLSVHGNANVTLNGLSGVFDGIISNACPGGQGFDCPGTDTDTNSPSGSFNLGGVNGTISPTSLSLAGSFADQSPGTCSGTFTLSGTTQGAINPETSATAVQSQAADAQSALSPTGVVGQVSHYTASLIRTQRSSAVQLSANSMRLSSRGLSAGDHMAVPFGVWLAGSYTASEDDFVTAPFESDRLNLTGGLDTSVTDELIVGLSLGLEAADTETSANNGQSDTFGFTVAPYMAYLIDDTTSVDFAIGYSHLSHDQARGAGRSITNSTNTARVFAAGNGNWANTYGNWYLSARSGITWLSSELDESTESNGTVTPRSVFRIGQINVGAEAAYSYDEWEPYVGGTLSHAYTKTRRQFAAGVATPSDDRTDLLLNAGVRFFGGNGMSGGVDYSTLLLRDNFTEHSLQLNIRMEY